MAKAIVSLSGGLDSAVVLAEALDLKMQVVAYGFYYGSKHNTYENVAAHELTKHYHVPFNLINMANAFQYMNSDLLLKGGEVPEGHYEEETMRRTVVPGRNLIFASILAGIAKSNDYDSVWMGTHQGDHFIYPDCRPRFFGNLRSTLWEAFGDETVSIITPFLYTDKVGVVAKGLKLGVPFGITRTCYKAQPVACGKCGSCQERLAAFAGNGVKDPLEYESREILPRRV